MIYVFAILYAAGALLLLYLLLKKPKEKCSDFDRNGTHKNGTRYDENGYDVYGYNKEGYNRNGFNAKGYNADGYDVRGYNSAGKNAKGQYNRLYDRDAFSNGQYSVDGFLSPSIYPIKLSLHSIERMRERLAIGSEADMRKLATDAYRYGKSARQVMRSTAARMQDIEQRHDGGVVLLYRNYVFIFSSDNILITVYQNEGIS